MKRVVDVWDLLKKDGSLPEGPPNKRAAALRLARLIEYGGPLEAGHCRETLVECTRQPGRKRCPGLLWVTKLPDGTIQAGCMVCKHDEVHVSNWEETTWADGPMEPVRVADGPSELQ